MNRTVIFGKGNVPADWRAVEASRGRWVRIIEDARVSGRSGVTGREGMVWSGGVEEDDISIVREISSFIGMVKVELSCGA